ncbi:hypothetical protein [Pedobacter sp. MC2016-05]
MCKQHTGKSPSQFILRRILQQAEYLLIASS